MAVWVLGNTKLAAITNGGFETGDLTDWTVSIPSAWSAFGDLRPAGSAGVIGAWTLNDNGTPPGNRYPVAGENFLSVGTSGNAFFTNAPSVTYDISVSQTQSFQAGDLLSGYSFFYNGDYEEQDSAWVRILDGDGNQVANPWFHASGPNPNINYRDSGPWTYWQWLAPADGVYTLDLGVSTFGDNRFASYGFHDDITVMSSAVPEPAAGSLILLGAGLVALRRFRKK